MHIETFTSSDSEIDEIVGYSDEEIAGDKPRIIPPPVTIPTAYVLDSETRPAFTQRKRRRILANDVSCATNNTVTEGSITGNTEVQTHQRKRRKVRVNGGYGFLSHSSTSAMLHMQPIKVHLPRLIDVIKNHKASLDRPPAFKADGIDYNLIVEFCAFHDICDVCDVETVCMFGDNERARICITCEVQNCIFNKENQIYCVMSEAGIYARWTIIHNGCEFCEHGYLAKECGNPYCRGNFTPLSIVEYEPMEENRLVFKPKNVNTLIRLRKKLEEEQKEEDEEMPIIQPYRQQGFLDSGSTALQDCVINIVTKALQTMLQELCSVVKEHLGKFAVTLVDMLRDACIFVILQYLSGCGYSELSTSLRNFCVARLTGSALPFVADFIGMLLTSDSTVSDQSSGRYKQQGRKEIMREANEILRFLNTLFTFKKSLLSEITNVIKEFCPEFYVRCKLFSDPDAVKLFEEIDQIQLTDVDTDKLYYINELIRRWDEYFPKGIITPHELHLYRIQVGKIAEMRVIVRAKIQKRQRPLVVYLYGESHTGKTASAANIGKHLAQQVFGVEQPLVYSRSQTDYWDGYNGEAVVLYDDLLYSSEDPRIDQFLSICSCDPVRLNMAGLNEKGTYFSSKVIVVTSNLAEPKPPHYNCVRALWNRFDIYAKVVMCRGVQSFVLSRIGYPYPPKSYTPGKFMSVCVSIGNTLIQKEQEIQEIEPEPIEDHDVPDEKYFRRGEFGVQEHDQLLPDTSQRAYIVRRLNAHGEEIPITGEYKQQGRCQVCGVQYGEMHVCEPFGNMAAEEYIRLQPGLLTRMYQYFAQLSYQNTVVATTDNLMSWRAPQAVASFFWNIRDRWRTKTTREKIVSTIRGSAIFVLGAAAVVIFRKLIKSIGSYEQQSGNYERVVDTRTKVAAVSVRYTRQGETSKIFKDHAGGTYQVIVSDQKEDVTKFQADHVNVFATGHYGIPTMIDSGLAEPHFMRNMSKTLNQLQLPYNTYLYVLRNYKGKVGEERWTCYQKALQDVFPLKQSDLLRKRNFHNRMVKIMSYQEDGVVHIWGLADGEIVTTVSHVISCPNKQKYTPVVVYYRQQKYHLTLQPADVSYLGENQLCMFRVVGLAAPRIGASFTSTDPRLVGVINDAYYDVIDDWVPYKTPVANGVLVKSSADVSCCESCAHQHTLISHRLSTKDGDCGFPLVCQNTQKIIGMHVGLGRHNDQDCAYAIPICQQEYDTAKRRLDKCGERISVTIPMIGASTTTAVGTALRDVGSAEHRCHIPRKSSLVPSRLCGVFGEPKKEPAVLDSRDPRYTGNTSILQNALKKMSKPVVQPESHLLQQISDYMVKKYSKHDGVNIQVLTEEQNLNGIEGVIGIDRPNYATSNGEPYIHLDELFVVDEDDRVHFTEFGKTEFQKVEASLSTELSHRFTFATYLKDETRAIPKIASGSTRAFMGCNKIATMVSRKYLLAFTANLQRTWKDHAVAVGINPLGDDWHQLANFLLNNSEHVFAADYSDFDGSLYPAFFAILADVVNAWYNDEHSEIRRRIISEYCCSEVVVGGRLYRKTHGLPSGCFGTAQFNSLINEMIFLYAFLRIVEKDHLPYTLKDFDKNVVAYYFGDDNVQSVSEKFYFYNLARIAKELSLIGIGLTGEDKQQLDFADAHLPLTGLIKKGVFRKLHEVTFLKRGFVYQDGRWTGPLDQMTIENMVNFKPRNVMLINGKSWEDEVVHTVLQEAQLHGSEYHRRLLKDLDDYGYPWSVD